jgi:ankyrin repeat protein
LRTALRAHPVRGKGSAHLKQNKKRYEPSFSLTLADSRRDFERKVVMGSKDFPARPNLEQYKKQAKELVKAWRTGDPEAIQRIQKNHPRIHKWPEADFRRVKVALADAQFVIAREYGFASWPKFAKHIQTLIRDRSVESLENPVAALIEAACVPRDSGHRSGTLESAEAILARYPEVARSDIYVAAILGDDAGVRRFVARDAANATAKDGPYGWDALTHLCFSRYLRLDRTRSEGFVRAARTLLDAGASAKTGFWEKDHQPKPQWESVIYGAAGVARHAELTRLLLERGADPNDEETPYHTPETYDNDALKVVVESGKLSEDSLATMLLRKADWHDDEGMKYLLEHGADPNRMTRWHYTALHQAVRRDNGIEKIEMLLVHGADPTLKNGLDGKSAVEIAARRGRGDVLELIGRRGILIELDGVERLIAACARNEEGAIRSMSTNEPQIVRELLKEGGTLLAEFAGVGNTHGVRRLLDLGVNVGALYEKGDAYFDITPNSTALHVAAWHAWPSTVELLIERGAVIDAHDRKERTPLALAVRACVDSYWTHRRSPESVEMLLRAGASVDGVEYLSGYAEVDELLRRYGKEA